MEEFSEGLDILRSFIRSLYGYEVGEGFTETLLSDRKYYNNETPSNHRVILDNTSAETVTLPEFPEDGARFAVLKRDSSLSAVNVTLDANGRTIEGATSKTLSDAYLAKEWFYRADLGDWILISSLDADSESPFPYEFDDFLILSLAVRISPSAGVSTAPETMEYLRQQKSKLRARYRQTKAANSPAALRTRYSWFGSSTDFDSGQVV